MGPQVWLFWEQFDVRFWLLLSKGWLSPQRQQPSCPVLKSCHLLAMKRKTKHSFLSCSCWATKYTILLYVWGLETKQYPITLRGVQCRSVFLNTDEQNSKGFHGQNWLRCQLLGGQYETNHLSVLAGMPLLAATSLAWSRLTLQTAINAALLTHCQI